MEKEKKQMPINLEEKNVSEVLKEYFEQDAQEQLESLENEIRAEADCCSECCACCRVCWISA